MASTHHLAGLLTLASALLTSCTSPEHEPPAAKRSDPSVVAVNYPLAYFAARMAPTGIKVDLPVPTGVDPAYWKPTPDEVATVQAAGAILLNGAGYARWTRYASLPSSATVITAGGCRASFLPGGETELHQHGPEGEHTHGDTAFTTWLDFDLARCQAAAVRDALVALSPDDAEGIRTRFEELDEELAALHARAKDVANRWGSGLLLASHPVYQYLGDAYGLQIESLHLEPDAALTKADLDRLRRFARANDPAIMLWEATPDSSVQRQLRALGIVPVVFDPTSQAPRGGDFLDQMRANVHRLACATGAETCE